MARAFAAFVVLLLWTGRAAADGRVTLRWSAPAACPTHATVAAKIARAIDDHPRALDVAVEATVTETERGYRLSLTTTREDSRERGQRVIEDRSCEVLADAVAVFVAIATDPSQPAAPETTESSLPPAPPPEPAPARPPLVSTPTRPVEIAKESESPPVEYALGASVGAAFGPLPQPRPAFGVHGSIMRSFLRVDLGAQWLPSSRAVIDDASSAGGTFELLSATGAVHARWIASGLEIGPRVGAAYGRIRAIGFGVSTPIAATATWVAFEIGATAALRTSRAVAIRFDAIAEVPFARSAFVIEGLGPVHRPAAFGGRVTLGGELRF
jgi:hypothetical protein